ncbi:7043_t:CDS:1, partial [Cetraspora pellucida]
KAFEKESLKFYNPINQLVLQEVQFNIQDKNYLINYYKENENQCIDTFVKVINKGSISQNVYRNLATLQSDLLQDYNISNAKKKINLEMNKEILIFILDLENIFIIANNKIFYISDQNIEDAMLKYVEKAEYKRIIDILLFIILSLIE